MVFKNMTKRMFNLLYHDTLKDNKMDKQANKWTKEEIKKNPVFKIRFTFYWMVMHFNYVITHEPI